MAQVCLPRAIHREPQPSAAADEKPTVDEQAEPKRKTHMRKIQTRKTPVISKGAAKKI